MRCRFTISALALVFMGCAGQPLTEHEIQTADFGTLPENWQMMVAAEFNRTHRLFDPGSAQYAFSDPIRAKDGKSYGYKVTLWVNAKNRFGGYTGQQAFNYFIRDREVRQVDAFATSMRNSMNE